MLRSGILSHGSLLVRGAVGEPRVGELVDGIDRAFADAENHGARKQTGELSPWFEPFRASDSYPAEMRQKVARGRKWVRMADGVWGADSPRMMFHLLDTLDEVGLSEVIAGYLGERPAMTVDKCTLRRVGATCEHRLAPGRIVPRQRDPHRERVALPVDVRARRAGPRHRPQPASITSWRPAPRARSSTGPSAPASSSGSRQSAPVVRPEYEPGDVLLFDEFFLHRTATEPSMTPQSLCDRDVVLRSVGVPGAVRAARRLTVNNYWAFLPMRESNDLLGDPGALRARFDEDSYLYFRGVLDCEKIETLRRRMLTTLADQGWVRKKPYLMRGVATAPPAQEGEEDYFRVYDEVQRLEEFHSLAHDETLLDIMRQVLGDGAFPHPLKIARLGFPAHYEISTPPHQDYPNNQGTPNLTAAWVPVGECPQELGGLAILRGSHRYGLLPLTPDRGPGNRKAMLPEQMLEDLRWVTTDYSIGDVIVFHSHTVHAALHNASEVFMRLSVDFRYQLEGEALTETCLRPHFERLTWDDIYSRVEVGAVPVLLDRSRLRDRPVPAVRARRRAGPRATPRRTSAARPTSRRSSPSSAGATLGSDGGWNGWGRCSTRTSGARRPSHSADDEESSGRSQITAATSGSIRTTRR